MHRLSGHRDAIAIVLSCPCGWTHKFCAGRTPWRRPRRCVAHGPNIQREIEERRPRRRFPYADGVRPQFGTRLVVLQFLATMATLR